MPKTANLNIRIDPETKAGAEKLYAKLGITITDAVNMFLYQSLIDGGLPFQPKVKSALDERLIVALERTPAKEYTLDMDECGGLIIDKDLHPELYDWAVNG
jgi:DNA-damage-inducible protein J